MNILDLLRRAAKAAVSALKTARVRITGPHYTIVQEADGSWSIRCNRLAFESGFATRKSAEKELEAIRVEGGL